MENFTYWRLPDFNSLDSVALLVSQTICGTVNQIERKNTQKYRKTQNFGLNIFLMFFLAFCNNSPCQNGGTCTEVTLDYTCTCATGFHGQNCEFRKNTVSF